MDDAKADRRQCYEIYRNRMQHEDNLIGQRITWLVSSQAFLLTPYALLHNNPAYFVDVEQVGLAPGATAHFDKGSFFAILLVLRYSIICIGLLSCIFTYRSMTAAIYSMAKLTADYTRWFGKDHSYEPGIGLARTEGISGLFAPRGFFGLFTTLWTTLLLVRIATDCSHAQLTMKRCLIAAFAGSALAIVAAGSWMWYERRKTKNLSYAKQTDIPKLKVTYSAGKVNIEVSPKPEWATKLKIQRKTDGNAKYDELFNEEFELVASNNYADCSAKANKTYHYQTWWFRAEDDYGPVSESEMVLCKAENTAWV